MDHILEYKEFLFELGEMSSRTFKWKETEASSNTVQYEFETDKDVEYRVVFRKISNNDWHFGFMAKPPEATFFSYDYVTGRGDIFNVLTTIYETVSDFVENYLYQDDSKDGIIEFIGISSDDTMSTMEKTKRTRVFSRFFKSTFKDAKIKGRGNKIKVIFPPKD